MASTGRPITSHGAFAPLVGLWFAALLGGGLFVMPYAVHDTIAAGTRLDTLVAAGSATRLAVSAAGALLGLLLGIAIAARIARGQDAFDDAGEESWSDEWAEPVAEDAAPPADSVWLGEKADPVPLSEAPAEGDDQAPRPRMFNPREELGDGLIASSAPADDTPHEPSAISALMEEWHASNASEDEPRESPEEDREEAGHATASAIEDAEFEEEADELQPRVGTPALPTAALGDLSLGELTERLAVALARSKAATPGAVPATQVVEEPDASEEEPDPVIAFLRREADRGGAARGSVSGDPDPQSSLRSALERLSQVRGPQ